MTAGSSGELRTSPRARQAFGRSLIEAPAVTATGALARYVSQADAKNFQPVNITFALLPPLDETARRAVRKKHERRKLQVEVALKEWTDWLEKNYKEAAQISAG